MTSLPLTSLTKRRQLLLDRIAAETGAHFTLLALLDHDGDEIVLLPSYLRSEDPTDRAAIENTVHSCGVGGEEPPSAGALEAAIEDYKHSALAPYSRDGRRLWHRVLTTEWMPIESDSQCDGAADIGVIILDGDEASLSPASVADIATLVAAGRYQRFASTVLRTQRELSKNEGDLDQTIIATSRVLMAELGASEFLYRNMNSGPDWMKYSTGSDEAQRGSDTEGSGPPDRPYADTPVSERSPQGQTIEVSLSQRAYELASMPFCNISTTSKHLKPVRSRAVELSFRKKSVNGYLQNWFSETDNRIVEVVYRNLQNFAELKLSDESYSQVFSALHDKSVTPDGNADSFLDILQGFSAIIENVHILSVELLEDEIETYCDSAKAKPPLDQDYVSRLKKRYLDKFYRSENRVDYTQMMVGMDAENDRAYLEIHTPIEFGNSRIYVLSLRGSYIAQSTFEAIIDLFSEIFTRMRKDDFIRARSNSLIEIRHAVVQHFSAAAHGMDNIQTKWDRGLRNREYWLSLLDDPVFPESLGDANWSLHHARLILENGRFLVDEIDARTIARKPFNMLQVVRDCLRVLRPEARRKSIVFNQKVRGQPPTVTNGDEVLMRIAVMNLIDNAIKYSLVGAMIEWELIYKSDRYEFRVSNLGDPLSKAKLRQLLQIGVRGKQRDHLNIRPGTGLGLPVAFRILKAHSRLAELNLHSETHSNELGGATNTFFFEMPYLTGLGHLTNSPE